MLRPVLILVGLLALVFSLGFESLLEACLSLYSGDIFRILPILLPYKLTSGSGVDLLEFELIHILLTYLQACTAGLSFYLRPCNAST